jgi:hypothetical protein
MASRIASSRQKRPRGSVMERILPLLDGTRTTQEIADAVGTDSSHVWRTASRLGRMGDLRKIYAVRDQSGLRVSFPADVRAWLKAETPEGATVADLIRAIVQDAYDDAKEGRG